MTRFAHVTILAALALAFLWACPAFAQKSAPAVKPAEQKPVDPELQIMSPLDVKDADIQDVIRTISKGYNLNIIANKTYYNQKNQSFAYGDSSGGFFIRTIPQILFAYLNTSANDGNQGPNGSWSEFHNFTFNVTDEDGDYDTIQVWKRQWSAPSPCSLRITLSASGR